jgi:hypothetical protein
MPFKLVSPIRRGAKDIVNEGVCFHLGEQSWNGPSRFLMPARSCPGASIALLIGISRGSKRLRPGADSIHIIR